MWNSNEKGDEKDNKYTACIYNHISGKYITHFIENTSYCVPEENQPNKTFLDEDDNKYKGVINVVIDLVIKEQKKIKIVMYM